jgi:transcriptional regulator with XRE-family HTH domain
MDEAMPNRIRELRDERGWSVRDLADRVVPKWNFNKVHRLETGASVMDVNDMRALARVFAVKPSALLNDVDVEFRADNAGLAIIQELDEIPPEDRHEVLKMAREMVRITRIMAPRTGGAPLAGDSRLALQMSDLWNEFDHEHRVRALDLWRAAGLSR